FINDKLLTLSETVDGSKVEITEITSVTGDVNVNQRKGKIISIFDIAISINWKGETEEGETANGKINIPEFDHDTEPNEIPFETTVETSDATGKILLAIVKSKILPQIRTKLSTFGPDLREEHAKDVYIPANEMKGHPVNTVYQPKPPAPQEKVSSHQSNLVKGGLVSINQSIEFTASASDIFETLTNPQRVVIWTRSKGVSFVPEVGKSFTLFDGNVNGSFEEIVKDKKIVQKWRLGSWPKDHFSTVTIELEEGRESTILKLTQTGVPVGEKDITENNWKNYYWNAIKATFGFGSLL
ncbi:hypothetical protein HK096_011147, partial [Nowakowskiella sp. JEL0078]